MIEPYGAISLNGRNSIYIGRHYCRFFIKIFVFVPEKLSQIQHYIVAVKALGYILINNT